MEIKVDDLSGREVVALLKEHMDDMLATSPPESVHALDLEGLKQPNIEFWSIWNQGSLAGCGALKHISQDHGEIKSMRTSKHHRRLGIGRKMLQHIIDTAISRGYTKLSLETGSQDYFAPARKLYEAFGFTECRPFADYSEDPNSVFMTREI